MKPAQTKFEITFLFNQYTGNFNQEFSSYVFGSFADHSAALKLAKQAEKEMGEELMEEIQDHVIGFYGEFGWTQTKLTEYQGNGIGTFGITIEVDEEFMTKYAELAIKRSKDFGVAISNLGIDQFTKSPIILKTVKIVKIITTFYAVDEITVNT